MPQFSRKILVLILSPHWSTSLDSPDVMGNPLVSGWFNLSDITVASWNVNFSTSRDRWKISEIICCRKTSISCWGVVEQTHWVCQRVRNDVIVAVIRDNFRPCVAYVDNWAIFQLFRVTWRIQNSVCDRKHVRIWGFWRWKCLFEIGRASCRERV